MVTKKSTRNMSTTDRNATICTSYTGQKDLLCRIAEASFVMCPCTDCIAREPDACRASLEYVDAKFASNIEIKSDVGVVGVFISSDDVLEACLIFVNDRDGRQDQSI